MCLRKWVPSKLIDYYPFGEIRFDQKEGDFNESKKYTGYQYDSETDLNYAGARYQSGRVGRFMGQDPVALNIGSIKDNKQLTDLLVNPQKLNSYSYTENNPIKNIDPDGEASLRSYLSNPISTSLCVFTLKTASDFYSAMNSGATKYSKELFNKSLSLNPKTLTVTEQSKYSGLVEKIKASDEYNKFISSAVSQANSDGLKNFNYSYYGEKSQGSKGDSINFVKGDLLTSIGGTLRTNVSGQLLDSGSWALNVSVHDQYGFDFHGREYYQNNTKITTLNNSMLIPQTLGAISKYNININFSDNK